MPWHQRYYDWSSTQVTELLFDIDEALNEDRASYFLGSIMLVKRNENYEINDGQQRLITLSLIFAALARRFEQPPDYDTELIALCKRMLFVVNEPFIMDKTRQAHLKIRIDPPKHDRSRFGQIVRGREIGTNGKLTAAWKEIGVFIRGMSSEKAKKFVKFLSQKVEIAVLDVHLTEDINAIFETLNGRGKTLDDLDLIRNHLYSYFSKPDDEVRREEVHERIESILGTTRVPTKSQDYFRCFFQCEYGYLQRNRFYRETRQRIREKASNLPAGKYVYDLTERLADLPSVELFRTMVSRVPNIQVVDSFCRASWTSQAKRNLRVFLRELRSYSVTHPLLFALLRQFLDKSRYEKKSALQRKQIHMIHTSISDLTSFIMRVSFCAKKFEPSRFEFALSNCAQRVSMTQDLEDIKILENLRELDEFGVMDDRHFIELMSGMRMNDARRAKRYLFGIVEKLQGDHSVLNIDGCTVEHILPKAPEHWEGWQGFSSEGPDLSAWVNRMGNFTLLGQGDNQPSRRFNRDFASKRNVFSESSFHITRDLERFGPEWTPQAIEARSRMFAKEAVKVWKFSAP